MKRLIILLLFILNNSFSQNTTNETITIYDKSVLTIIDKNAKIEILGVNFKVAEGPLWDEKNKRLIFTDVRQNKIFTWDKLDGINEFISPSGSTGYAPSFDDGGIGANGLAFNSNGEIIICQHGDRRIAFIGNEKNENPKFETIVDNYNGKRFNSPNDLSLTKSGDIYFTDPPYGFKNFNNKFRELNFNGVFKYYSNGKIDLISKEMTRPNGVVLSRNEKYIYVNTTYSIY